MKRRGYSREVIHSLHRAFRLLLSAKLNTSQAIEKIREEMNDTPEIETLVRFIETSQRGVVK
jgi:UDP-N-acetylglucosamine acyltransferase